MGDWSPTLTMLTPLEGDEYVRAVRDREHPAPRNGVPLPRPYTYGGADFTVTDPPRMQLSRHTPARKAGPPPIDPGGPDVPFSAPREWLAELAQEAL
jgi:hypothetical protein